MANEVCSSPGAFSEESFSTNGIPVLTSFFLRSIDNNELQKRQKAAFIQKNDTWLLSLRKIYIVRLYTDYILSKCAPFSQTLEMILVRSGTRYKYMHARHKRTFT